ncbi:MAG: flagellar biosynthetic protein FliR [Pirellulales bacterium]|nr:flagellar biosynthetic protein FliR [Pirellulales bacterium]
MTTAVYWTPLVTFLLVAARMAGMCLTAPLFGVRSLPWQVRLVLPAMLALTLTPMQWSAGMPDPSNVLGFSLHLAGEALIGAVLGVGLMLLLAGAQIAGQIISQMSGLSLAEVYGVDFEASAPLFSHLLYMLALTVYVIVGGHRMLIGAVLDSYVALPLGRVVAPPSLAMLLATLATESFSLGIRVAAPAVVALLLSTIAIGFITRTLPQINAFTIGLALNIAITFMALAASVGAMAWLFQEQIEPGIETILDAIRVGS